MSFGDDTLDPSVTRNIQDGGFLNWVADRFVKVYKESENVDFVLRLREIAERLKKG